MDNNTTPPTDDELAAMRARVGAATAFDKIELGYFEIECWSDEDYNVVGQRISSKYQAQNDKAFLTLSRSDMQTLLDEVARLRNDNERLLEHIWRPFSALKYGQGMTTNGLPPFKMPASWKVK